jgi:hypothetical protein
MKTAPARLGVAQPSFEVIIACHDTGIHAPDRVFSVGKRSDLQRTLAAPVSIAQLRQKLGRTGLLDSTKIALVKARPDEVPNVPGTIFLGWVSQRAGRLVRDRRRRVTIKLTDDALASLRSAVETVGHELYHIAEMLAGSGASEKAAEDAAKAFLESFVKRFSQLH